MVNMNEDKEITENLFYDIELLFLSQSVKQSASFSDIKHRARDFSVYFDLIEINATLYKWKIVLFTLSK